MQLLAGLTAMASRNTTHKTDDCSKRFQRAKLKRVFGFMENLKVAFRSLGTLATQTTFARRPKHLRMPAVLHSNRSDRAVMSASIYHPETNEKAEK